MVISRNVGATDARLKPGMQVIIHKHPEAVKEIGPTGAKRFHALQFLTAKGHMCTDWRQNFILLSDGLGVPTLVDAINTRKPAGHVRKHRPRAISCGRHPLNCRWTPTSGLTTRAR